MANRETLIAAQRGDWVELGPILSSLRCNRQEIPVHLCALVSPFKNRGRNAPMWQRVIAVCFESLRDGQCEGAKVWCLIQNNFNRSGQRDIHPYKAHATGTLHCFYSKEYFSQGNLQKNPTRICHTSSPNRIHPQGIYWAGTGMGKTPTSSRGMLYEHSILPMEISDSKWGKKRH